MRQHHLSEIKNLMVNTIRDENIKIVLFGSSARGDYRASSDIDIGILTRNKFDVKILTALREQIEHMNIPYKVEIVYLNETSEQFKNEALKGAVLWKDWK